jgi:DNA modification methylase
MVRPTAWTPAELPHGRLCDCPPKHLNCLTASEWKKCQIGVWRFHYDGRDLRDKQAHPAMYPVSLAERCIELFTHCGELVLDPFVGSGSTLLAAAATGRNAVGFDLNAEYITLSQGRLAGVKSREAEQLAVCGDARAIAQHLRPGTVSLIVTSPPYSDLLNRPRANKSRRERENEQFGKVEQYSQDERDLGLLPADEFAQQMGAIFAALLPLLTPRGHCVINVADTWMGGEVQERVPVHYLVKAAMDRAGYRLRNTIIWDRNDLVNDTGFFGWPSSFITMGTTFEFLLDFVAAASAPETTDEAAS